VVPIEGFNPGRIRNLKDGMEATLVSKIATVAILDRDYRSDAECEAIIEQTKWFCDHVTILKRKEIENFLLCPTAIDRAAANRVADRARRSGSARTYENLADVVLAEFAAQRKNYVASQIVTGKQRFERGHGRDESSIGEQAMNAFDKEWADPQARMCLLPGKEALSVINTRLQSQYGVTVTPTSIIAAMRAAEIPAEMRLLVDMLSQFSTSMV
jgi:hypothetical protein